MLIGIDIGTSFIKAGVLDLDTMRVMHVQRVPFPEPLTGLPSLYREFDPHEVVNCVRAVLHGMKDHDTFSLADDCQGILMCTQMHGVVWTTADGEPRSNLTTWQDQRVLETNRSGESTYFDAMRSRLSDGEIRQLGNELRPGLPVGLFFWMAEQGKLPDRNVIPAALSDFVIAHLCSACPVTDSTNAMAFGLLNVETLVWHSDVMDKLGLKELNLPEVLPHGSVAGWLNWEGRKIPCYTPIGDYQCALLGALLQPDELSLNISTGSQVSMIKDSAEFGDFQTRPFFDGRYATTITHIPAGRALNALVRLLSELAVSQGVELEDPWVYITEAATKAPPPKMHANLAFYSSASGDHGALMDIQEDELTVGHLFRAAFQNMAENYFNFAKRLSPQQSWNNLVFSGGLVQKIDVLRQLICDQFKFRHARVTYRLSPVHDETLLGLMALGLAFTGRTRTVSDAVNVLAQVYNAESSLS